MSDPRAMMIAEAMQRHAVDADPLTRGKRRIRDFVLDNLTTQNSPVEWLAQKAFPDYRSSNQAGIYADEPDVAALAQAMAGPIAFHGSPVRGLKQLELGEARNGRALGRAVYATTSPTESAAYSGPGGSIYQLDIPSNLLDMGQRVSAQGEIGSSALRALTESGGGQSRLPVDQMVGYDVYRELVAALGQDGAASALRRAGVVGVSDGTKRALWDPATARITKEHPDYASAKAAYDAEGAK